MSGLDIIEVPGYPGLFARRVAVEAWQRAGSPRLNDAGRLHSQQKAAWDAFQAGAGSPADNPDDPSMPNAHVRFVAFDIANPDPARLRAAGFEQPYVYEPWHWQLKNVWQYPLVHELPTTVTEDEEEDEMRTFITTSSAAVKFELRNGRKRSISREEWAAQRALQSQGMPMFVATVPQSVIDGIPGQ